VHESGDDDDTGLDEDELEILKDAGIISRPSKTRKRRSPQYLAKHVVFVENEEEGMHGKFTGLSGYPHVPQHDNTQQMRIPKPCLYLALRATTSPVLVT
jgi:hypothetical protein